MQRVVIDTNVFISALIQRSFPFLIICISDEVLQEYYAVLKRKKFSEYTDFVSRAEMLLAFIETNAHRYNPTVRLNVITDTDDNKFLDLAVESKAHFIVTGNTNDFKSCL
jgi:putative PIN family toxin of toxin-antitoxin system